VPDVVDAPMPEELSPRHLRVRLLQLAALVVLVVVAIWVTPGLGDLRHRLDHAAAGWLVVAAVAELLSTLSYVVIFRSVFCVGMPWALSYRIGMAEQAANSLLPAGGAGGLALGAWALSRGGMKAEHIARRTVAFFLLTSLANVGTLIVFAVGFAVGILHGDTVPAFTYGFAGAGVIGFAVTFSLPALHSRFSARRAPLSPAAGRVRVATRHGIDALADGIRDAGTLLLQEPLGVLTGAFGYMVFDIVAIGTAFAAFGYSPPVGVLVAAYLIGQLGGLLPLPGGIGGVEGGLIGSYALYHVPVAASGAAVLAYRVLALWIPAGLGSIAFVQLRSLLRGNTDAPTICEPLSEPIATGSRRQSRRRMSRRQTRADRRSRSRAPSRRR
jgi:uncharacterized membrane protein YbhN (UPF0104 family)